MGRKLNVDELRSELEALGAKPVHVRRLLKAWLRGEGLPGPSSSRTAPLPRRLLDALPQITSGLDAIAVPISEHPGADGSVRTLLRLADGLTAESVLLLRDGLCVSTRNLTSAEILAQVALARLRRKVRRVVFMGMGEPSQNLRAVLETMSLLGGEGGLAHKLLVFSTVGDRKIFERLAAHDVKPAMALSLHTTDAALRERLLPRAPRVPPEELVELAESYARRTTWPIQYQWTLIEGVNDGDSEVERLGEMMRGKYGVVNFIPYNHVDGLEFRRTGVERAREMARALHRRGVLAKIRRSAGQDVEGACGQLRARDTSRGPAIT